MRFLLVILLLFSSSLSAACDFEKGKSWSVKIPEDRFLSGFFSMFGVVVGALELYDQGNIASLSLDFGKRGFYYNPERGDNWWTYYFEPFNLPVKSTVLITLPIDQLIRRRLFDVSLESGPERNFELIQKYIKIKKNILKKVESFQKARFKGRFVVGIHYRATDKFLGEAPEMSRQDFIKRIIEETETFKDPYFFVATDDAFFIDEMLKVFPDKVFFLDAERSETDQPIHTGSSSPDKQGEEALLDCLLLSKTNFLIRTSSNLSLASTWFNPTLPVVLVNPGIHDGKQATCPKQLVK